MSDSVIRALTFEDLGEAQRLSTTAGWNQQADDWRMLLRLAPAGAFAALIDARLVGTAIGIDYGGFAWIAMMLVDPAYRGRGLGRRLLEAAMGSVPPNLRIRLDATPLGRPLYQRYGFEDEATLSRHVSDGSNRGGASVSEAFDGSRDVRPLTPSDLEIVIEQDSQVFGGMRGAVLDWAFHRAPRYAYVVRGDNGLMQYCLGRQGRLLDQIGPVVAGHEDMANALVKAALAAAGDRPVAVDAFDSQPAFSAALRSLGFVVERPLIRMSRAASAAREQGVPALAPAFRSRLFSSSRADEFAIFGPEFA
jgi:ribosomal protein S18 acetylase RimI-like enzyme